MVEKRLHLFQLVSPALPVGGFSYSEGLEWLVQHGRLGDAATLRCWLEAELRWGCLTVEAATLPGLMALLERARSADPLEAEAALQESESRFRALADEDIERYLATGEPYERPGGYSLGGRGGMFVERIDGSPSGADGLPLAETCGLLCSSSFHPGWSRRTSTESRMATTVAERGACVNRAISPMTWPRAISRSMRSSPWPSRA